MRDPDGGVRMGSGSINARAGSLGHPAGPPRARAADPRPRHVRMRDAHTIHGSWNAVADSFGYATADGARTYVLRREREVKPAAATPPAGGPGLPSAEAPDA